MIAVTHRALIAATAKVTPQTPATVARRTVTRLSTCETPRPPQLNPPNGHAERIQSRTVQSAAVDRALTIGRPGRRSAGVMSPNRATDRAHRSVRAVHASVPNRQIQ